MVKVRILPPQPFFSLDTPMKTTSLTRRNFLERAAAFTAGGFVAAGSNGMVAFAQSAPHISFPGAPRDRLAVASYPFRAQFDVPGNRGRDAKQPGMDLAGFAAMVVQKFGVHNVEPHNRHFTSLEPAYLSGLRENLKKSQAQIVNIAVSTEQSFYDTEATARAQAVAFSKKWIDTAVAVGAPSIRSHIHAAKNSSPDVQRTAESLLEVANYGAEKNVVVYLENDDLVSEDAFFVVKVVEAVNHPYLRALPDFANSAMRGDQGFNTRALQAMFQRAYGMCHVKDGEANDDGKIIGIDLKAAFDILKASGFRGYCSMEFDQPGDPYAATSKLIDETLKYLS
jgi:sugar phosphate isomerase/epimerase